MKKFVLAFTVAVIASAAAAGGSFAQSTVPPKGDGETLQVLQDYPEKTLTALEQCHENVANLRTVYKPEILELVDEPVQLRPLCERNFAMDTNDMHTLFMDGNVDGLRATIARTPVLAAELAEGRYTVEDVIAIDIRSNMVILYVHRRNG